MKTNKQHIIPNCFNTKPVVHTDPIKKHNIQQVYGKVNTIIKEQQNIHRNLATTEHSENPRYSHIFSMINNDRKIQ